jgi:hypothetical protein
MKLLLLSLILASQLFASVHTFKIHASVDYPESTDLTLTIVFDKEFENGSKINQMYMQKHFKSGSSEIVFLWTKTQIEKIFQYSWDQDILALYTTENYIQFPSTASQSYGNYWGDADISPEHLYHFFLFSTLRINEQGSILIPDGYEDNHIMISNDSQDEMAIWGYLKK